MGSVVRVLKCPRRRLSNGSIPKDKFCSYYESANELLCDRCGRLLLDASHAVREGASSVWSKMPQNKYGGEAIVDFENHDIPKKKKLNSLARLQPRLTPSDCEKPGRENEYNTQIGVYNTPNERTRTVKSNT